MHVIERTASYHLPLAARHALRRAVVYSTGIIAFYLTCDRIPRTRIVGT